MKEEGARVIKKVTIWATQAQMVELFEVDQSVVSRHIRNIFKDGEIDKKAICKKCILQITMFLFY